MFTDVDPVPREVTTATLREVISGRSTRLPRVQAVREVSRREPADVVKVLTGLARASGEDSAVRLEATLGLARTAGARANDTFVDLLRSTDSSVRTGALRALASVGTESALPAIRALEVRVAAAGHAREADFAATLVSHRIGNSGHAFSTPPEARLIEPDASGATPIEVRPARKSSVVNILQLESLSPLGFEPSDGVRGLEFRCAGQRLLLLWDRVLEGGAQLVARRLLERPTIAGGIFSGVELSLGEYELSSYVLTKPSGHPREVQFAVMSTRGRIWAAGVATMQSDDVARFRARGVENKNALPLEVAGQFDMGTASWKIDTALSARRVRRERRPAKTPTKAT